MDSPAVPSEAVAEAAEVDAGADWEPESEADDDGAAAGKGIEGEVAEAEDGGRDMDGGRTEASRAGGRADIRPVLLALLRLSEVLWGAGEEG